MDDSTREPESLPDGGLTGPPARDTEELRFTDDEENSRYALYLGEDLVSTLEYRDDGATVAFTATFTEPAFRGHGYAGELTDRAVAVLEERGDRSVEAVCPFVVDWFERHPDRSRISRRRG
ncbi:GNAT family N-acetyltransferase [Promicromonospora sp. NPDC090134]|uniref:GNAT family N-acetyltransferase n=1 Tax=Promicromonospora sp. NPDC090134 TaxID=3364408 RepID=UPI0037F770F6